MPPQDFNFDYEKFLRETRDAYDETVWRALRERYGEGITAENFYRQEGFQYKTSYDDKPRLPYDIEGEVTDINEPNWEPLYRWNLDRRRDEWYYQYKPFDEWFTLVTITGEFLHYTRRNPSAKINAARTIRDQLDEKRFYKVERIY